MKKLLQTALFLIALGICAHSAKAQKTLIHYWNFNTLLTAYHVTATTFPPPLAADYSILDTNKAKFVYTLIPGTSRTAFDHYIDNVASADTTNNRLGAPAGQALRMRNPNDSAQMWFYIPSTGYSNIVIKYAMESSSTTSGDSVEQFDYSIDSGKTWKAGKANGMKVNGSNVDTLDTTPAVYQGSSWGLVKVDLSADAATNNNPKLVFRIRFIDGNTHLSSGNNRFDNVTVEGTGVSKPPPAVLTLTKPAASDILVVGRQTKITFNTFGPVTKKRTIEYSIDGGATWQPAGTITDSTNSFTWTVPNTPTQNGVIRVIDDNGVTTSSGKFIIYTFDPKTNTLIHYWDFNSFLTQYNNPGIPNIAPDFTALDNSTATIQYVLEAGTSSHYLGYIDNVPGDTINLRLGVAPLQGLRVRNPTDSMELRLLIPTTGFKNISLTYALQSSGPPDAPASEHFDYSVDGGINWKKGVMINGIADTLNVLLPQYQGITFFGRVSLNFGTDAAVNNNPNLILRIKFARPDTATSGNNRFDNISVDGTPSASSVSESSTDAQYKLYPNPAREYITISTPSEGSKSISIMDITGRIVLKSTDDQKNIILNTSNLPSGMYTVRIVDLLQNRNSMIKFVKE